jgi:hypothetical protein
VDDEVEEPDLVILSETQTDGNLTKHLRWTEEMDHWLGKILVDQVRKGLKIDNVFQTEAYDKAVSAMKAKFGHHLTKFNIKNRLKTWKKQYEIAKEILCHAGFKWDETKKMIVANDSTWIDYIRVCFYISDLENCYISSDHTKSFEWFIPFSLFFWKRAKPLCSSKLNFFLYSFQKSSSIFLVNEINLE